MVPSASGRCACWVGRRFNAAPGCPLRAGRAQIQICAGETATTFLPARSLVDRAYFCKPNNCGSRTCSPVSNVTKNTPIHREITKELNPQGHSQLRLDHTRVEVTPITPAQKLRPKTWLWVDLPF